MTETKTLTEIAQRILAFLEEAGQEEVRLTMLSIYVTDKSPDNIRGFVASLKDLAQLGYIRMAKDYDASRRLIKLSVADSIDAVAAISTYMQFSTENEYWFDSRVTGPPYSTMLPYIMLTDEGYRKAAEIMTARGWEWWNPRVKIK
jgi:hypothetical protein